MTRLPFLLLLSVPILAETAEPPAGALAAAVRHYRARDLEAAETLLLDLRRTRSDSAEAAFWLGRVHLARGRAQAAVAALEDATRLDPGSSTYHYWLAEALVARIDQVAVLFKLPVAQRMRAAYEKAVELDPENLEARVAVARYHAEAPLIAGGDPAAASAQLEEIRRRDPALAHVTQALIHQRLGRHQLVAEELAAAVRVLARDYAAAVPGARPPRPGDRIDFPLADAARVD